MPNFFKRAAKYVNAAANDKLEQRADPRIQIEQAVEEAQKQHAALTRQAGSVIGNVKSIEMKLARQLEEQGKARSSAAQALQLADRARAAGDEVKAASLERTAQSFAGQLVTLDASIGDLKHLHEQAEQQAVQARGAVESSATQLKGFLAQRSQLLTQLESAKMQEQVAKSLEQVSTLSAPGDSPTLEQVRSKIENRYAQAIGTSELASSSPGGAAAGDRAVLDGRRRRAEAGGDPRQPRRRVHPLADDRAADDVAPAEIGPRAREGLTPAPMADDGQAGERRRTSSAAGPSSRRAGCRCGRRSGSPRWRPTTPSPPTSASVSTTPIRSVGFAPVGQVMGASVFQIGWTGAWNCGIGYGGGFGGGYGGGYGPGAGRIGGFPGTRGGGGFGGGGFNSGGFSGAGMGGIGAGAGSGYRVGAPGSPYTVSTVEVTP